VASRPSCSACTLTDTSAWLRLLAALSAVDAVRRALLPWRSASVTSSGVETRRHCNPCTL
jgi:hypothetical protein